MNLFSIALLVVIGLQTLGCGKSDITAQIKIEMYAVPLSPEGASGDQAPRWQEYKFLRASWVNADGSSTIMHEELDAAALRIVERPQIILQKAAADYDASYSGLTLDFDGAIKGANRDGSELTTVLANTSINLTQALDLTELTNDITFVVKVQWNNTINSEGLMQSPSLTLSRQN